MSTIEERARIDVESWIDTSRAAECEMADELVELLTTFAKAELERAGVPEMREALSHPLLSQLFGEIEDSGTPEAARLWTICQAYMEVRDAALRKADGSKP